MRPRVVLGCHGCQVKPALHLRERVHRLPPSEEPSIQATPPAGFLKPDRFPPPEEPSLAQTNRRWRHSPTKETSASTPVERGPFRARHHAGPGMGRVYCAGICLGRVTSSVCATEQRKTPWTPMRKSRAWSSSKCCSQCVGIRRPPRGGRRVCAELGATRPFEYSSVRTVSPNCRSPSGDSHFRPRRDQGYRAVLCQGS